MDRIEHYREIVKDLIREYAACKPSYGQVEVEAVLDDDIGHYTLTYTGWIGDERINGDVIHIDIRDDKIWVQHDGTNIGIVDELLEAGVPKEHIVLGWLSPSERQQLNFAVC
ncbi:MAG: XisI protein [Armatimonadota bacterium]|nr:XisI protein [Armatimonadota bacterium]